MDYLRDFFLCCLTFLSLASYCQNGDTRGGGGLAIPNNDYRGKGYLLDLIQDPRFDKNKDIQTEELKNFIDEVEATKEYQIIGFTEIYIYKLPGINEAIKKLERIRRSSIQFFDWMTKANEGYINWFGIDRDFVRERDELVKKWYIKDPENKDFFVIPIVSYKEYHIPLISISELKNIGILSLQGLYIHELLRHIQITYGFKDFSDENLQKLTAEIILGDENQLINIENFLNGELKEQIARTTKFFNQRENIQKSFCNFLSLPNSPKFSTIKKEFNNLFTESNKYKSLLCDGRVATPSELLDWYNLGFKKDLDNQSELFETVNEHKKDKVFLKNIKKSNPNLRVLIYPGFTDSLLDLVKDLNLIKGYSSTTDFLDNLVTLGKQLKNLTMIMEGKVVSDSKYFLNSLLNYNYNVLLNPEVKPLISNKDEVVALSGLIDHEAFSQFPEDIQLGLEQKFCGLMNQIREFLQLSKFNTLECRARISKARDIWRADNDLNREAIKSLDGMVKNLIEVEDLTCKPEVISEINNFITKNSVQIEPELQLEKFCDDGIHNHLESYYKLVNLLSKVDQDKNYNDFKILLESKTDIIRNEEIYNLFIKKFKERSEIFNNWLNQSTNFFYRHYRYKLKMAFEKVKE